MKKIHIGTLPPPLGGISVYLYRLSKISKDDFFIDYNKMGKFKFNFWIIKQIFVRDRNEFVIHSNNTKIRLIFYFLSLTSNHFYSLVIHANTLFDDYNNLNIIYKLLIKKMLSKAKSVRVVNVEMKAKLIKMDLRINNIRVDPAFIPPPEEDELKINSSYNKKFLDFIENRKPLIISNAYALEFYKKRDLYGFDICIEVTNKLKSIFPQIGYIFALANENINKSYLDKMKKRILDLKIKENFFLLTGQKEIWPLFKKVDLMIRPTVTDGDSVSIREALFFNVPVIASDVVLRPKKCLLFHYSNLNELYKKSLSVLENIKGNLT